MTDSLPQYHLQHRAVDAWVQLDPPMSWPIWFAGEIADDQIRQPLSPHTRTHAKDLMAYCRTHAVETEVGLYWERPEAFAEFTRGLEQLAREVAADIGPNARVAVTGIGPSGVGSGWKVVTASNRTQN